MREKKIAQSNNGFTLIELIVVLVIMAIMMAFTAMGIFAWQDWSRMQQEDASAETIFLAAQNQLNEYAASGALEREILSKLKDAEGNYIVKQIVETGESSKKIALSSLKDSDGNHYIWNNLWKTSAGKTDKKKYQGDIVSVSAKPGDYEDFLNGNAGEEQKVLFAMITSFIYDKSILNDASILIEFSPDAGQVFAVCYSNRADGFSYGEEVGKVDVSDRTDSTRSKLLLGYYGVDSLSKAIKGKTKNELKIETGAFELRNEETLNVVYYPEEDKDVFGAGSDLIFTLNVYDAEQKGSADPKVMSMEFEIDASNLPPQSMSKAIGNRATSMEVKYYKNGGSTDKKNTFRVPLWVEWTEDGGRAIRLILDAADVQAQSMVYAEALGFTSEGMNYAAESFAQTYSFYRFGLDVDRIYLGLEIRNKAGVSIDDEIISTRAGEKEENRDGEYTTFAKVTRYANNRYAEYEIENGRHLYNMRYVADYSDKVEPDSVSDLTGTLKNNRDWKTKAAHHFVLKNDIDWHQFVAYGSRNSRVGNNYFLNSYDPEGVELDLQESGKVKIKSGINMDNIDTRTAPFPGFRALGGSDTLTQAFSADEQEAGSGTNYSLSNFTVTTDANELYGVYGYTAQRQNVSVKNGNLSVNDRKTNFDDQELVRAKGEHPTGLFAINYGEISKLTLDHHKVFGSYKVGGVTGENFGVLSQITLKNDKNEEGIIDDTETKFVSELVSSMLLVPYFYGSNSKDGKYYYRIKYTNKDANMLQESLEALYRDQTSFVVGIQDVGGICGYQKYMITADSEKNGKVTYDRLTNEAWVSGEMYVGGIIGRSLVRYANNDQETDRYTVLEVPERILTPTVTIVEGGDTSDGVLLPLPDDESSQYDLGIFNDEEKYKNIRNQYHGYNIPQVFKDVYLDGNDRLVTAPWLTMEYILSKFASEQAFLDYMEDVYVAYRVYTNDAVSRQPAEMQRLVDFAHGVLEGTIDFNEQRQISEAFHKPELQDYTSEYFNNGNNSFGSMYTWGYDSAVENAYNNHSASQNWITEIVDKTTLFGQNIATFKSYMKYVFAYYMHETGLTTQPSFDDFLNYAHQLLGSGSGSGEITGEPGAMTTVTVASTNISSEGLNFVTFNKNINYGRIQALPLYYLDGGNAINNSDANVRGAYYIGGIAGMTSNNENTGIYDDANGGVTLDSCVSSWTYTEEEIDKIFPARNGEENADNEELLKELRGIYYGGLVGYAKYTKFKKCSTALSDETEEEDHPYIFGRYYVGGIAGIAEYCSFENDSVNGKEIKTSNQFNVVGKTYVGGIAGLLGKPPKMNNQGEAVNQFEYQYNPQKTSLDDSPVGAASLKGNEISNLTNEGLTYALGTKTKYEDNAGWCGGICGYNSETINGCDSLLTEYAKKQMIFLIERADKSLDLASDYVGGLVGFNNWRINYKGTTESKISTVVFGSSYVGGGVGLADAKENSESRRYSTLNLYLVDGNKAGTVEENENFAGSYIRGIHNYVGGVLGYEQRAGVFNSNAITESFLVHGENYVGGFIGAVIGWQGDIAPQFAGKLLAADNKTQRVKADGFFAGGFCGVVGVQSNYVGNNTSGHSEWTKSVSGVSSVEADCFAGGFAGACIIPQKPSGESENGVDVCDYMVRNKKLTVRANKAFAGGYYGYYEVTSAGFTGKDMFEKLKKGIEGKTGSPEQLNAAIGDTVESMNVSGEAYNSSAVMYSENNEKQHGKEKLSNMDFDIPDKESESEKIVYLGSVSAPIHAGGLFGYVPDGLNLRVRAVNYANVTTTEKDENGFGYAGGIVGRVGDRMLIEDCANYGVTTSVSDYYGALTERNLGTIRSNSEDGWLIKNAVAVDNTQAAGASAAGYTGTYTYVGGLCGRNDGTIEGLYLVPEDTTKFVSGSSYVGGLTGENAGTIQKTIIKGQTAATKVEVSNMTAFGLFAGVNRNVIGTKQVQCENHVPISASDVNAAAFAGSASGNAKFMNLINLADISGGAGIVAQTESGATLELCRNYGSASYALTKGAQGVKVKNCLDAAGTEKDSVLGAADQLTNNYYLSGEVGPEDYTRTETFDINHETPEKFETSTAGTYHIQLYGTDGETPELLAEKDVSFEEGHELTLSLEAVSEIVGYQIPAADPEADPEAAPEGEPDPEADPDPEAENEPEAPQVELGSYRVMITVPEQALEIPSPGGLMKLSVESADGKYRLHAVSDVPAYYITSIEGLTVNPLTIKNLSGDDRLAAIRTFDEAVMSKLLIAQ